jgi:hypothetical protein
MPELGGRSWLAILNGYGPDDGDNAARAALRAAFHARVTVPDCNVIVWHVGITGKADDNGG